MALTRGTLSALVRVRTIQAASAHAAVARSAMAVAAARDQLAYSEAASAAVDAEVLEMIAAPRDGGGHRFGSGPALLGSLSSLSHAGQRTRAETVRATAQVEACETRHTVDSSIAGEAQVAQRSFELLLEKADLVAARDRLHAEQRECDDGAARLYTRRLKEQQAPQRPG